MSIYINDHDSLRNLSSESRAKFFAFCFAAIYLTAAIVAIVQVAA